MLDFFDLELRSKFALRKKSIIDEFLGEIEGIKHYPINTRFKNSQMICHEVLSEYVNELGYYGISVEDLIDYFFKEYLKENFDISYF